MTTVEEGENTSTKEEKTAVEAPKETPKKPTKKIQQPKTSINEVSPTVDIDELPSWLK